MGGPSSLFYARINENNHVKDTKFATYIHFSYSNINDATNNN